MSDIDIRKAIRTLQQHGLWPLDKAKMVHICHGSLTQTETVFFVPEHLAEEAEEAYQVGKRYSTYTLAETMGTWYMNLPTEAHRADYNKILAFRKKLLEEGIPVKLQDIRMPYAIRTGVSTAAL